MYKQPGFWRVWQPGGTTAWQHDADIPDENLNPSSDPSFVMLCAHQVLFVGLFPRGHCREDDSADAEGLGESCGEALPKVGRPHWPQLKALVDLLVWIFGPPVFAAEHVKKLWRDEPSILCQRGFVGSCATECPDQQTRHIVILGLDANSYEPAKAEQLPFARLIETWQIELWQLLGPSIPFLCCTTANLGWKSWTKWRNEWTRFLNNCFKQTLTGWLWSIISHRAISKVKTLWNRRTRHCTVLTEAEARSRVFGYCWCLWISSGP